METDGSANYYAENGKYIKSGETYHDAGDIVFNHLNPADAFNTIFEKISAESKDGSQLITLGGDHSISYPVVKAISGHVGKLNILHIDAHTDTYQNFEDHPYSHASPFARLLEDGCIQSLTQVGIRTMTKHHLDQAHRYGIQMVEMKDFSFEFIHKLTAPLYISLDLDALDPAFAPGVSHHEPGGLSSRQLIQILQTITVPILSADIVEYNPARDVHDMTAMVAYKMMKEIMSKML